MIKNVVLINDFAHVNGGAAQVCIQSAIELAKRGYNVILFAAMEPIDVRLQQAGVNVILTHQQDILSNPNRLSAVTQGLWNKKANKLLEKEILQNFCPHDTVVHVHGYIKVFSPSIFRVLSLYKFPVAITLHDYFLVCPNGGFYNYRSRKICEIAPMSLHCKFCNCDSRSLIHKVWRVLRQSIQKRTMASMPKLWIFPISEITEKQVSKYLPISRKRLSFFKVENPVELQDFPPFPLKSDGYYLFMARLSPEKGVDLFCRAISELGLKGQVLGDGYERDYYEKKYPNILFHGWVKGKNKYNCISKSKALVFPSLWYEGLPLSVLEAQSIGLPCIVPDRCAASEIVKDGENGYIFNTGVLDSLKKAILKMESTDLNWMQVKVKENWKHNDYSIETHCNKLIDIYNRMLSENNPSLHTNVLS